jgi:lipase chaperone LimK
MKKSVLITLAIIFAAILSVVLIIPGFNTHVVNPLGVDVNPPLGQHSDDFLISQFQANKNNELPQALVGTSLKGTEIDGLYPVDTDGNLLLSKSIKYRFEYFLSLMGEFELAQVMEMIKDDIKSNLDGPAKEQALKLFDDYVAYKFALTELEASLSAPESYEVNDIERMRSQLQQMQDVRREYLPVDAVDAFFGFDEIYDDFMLARLEVQNNQQLTASEKQEQLNGLEQNLPQDVQTMRDETQRISQVFLLTEELSKKGATSEDVYAINEQEFGQEAALRLQELNEQRNQWQSRVDSYVNEKQAIKNDDSLTQSEVGEQLLILKDSQFSPAELAKLSAYELMKKESSTQ